MADAVDALVAVVWVLTAICWAMTAYKLHDLARDPRNPRLRALCLALVAITLSLTTQRVGHWLDQQVGMLDFARVTANSLTLVAAGGGQAFLLYTTSQDQATRRRVRRRIAAMAICVAAIIVLYAFAPGRYAIDDPFVRSGDYYHLNTAPLIAPYVFVHQAYVLYAAVQIAVLAGRYARMATRPLLRFGLRLIVAGAIVGGGYVVVKVANMALYPLTAGKPGLSDIVIVISFTVSILLMLVGATIPSWGPLIGLDRLANAVAALRAYRRLGPLWSALRLANPDIVLLAQPRGLTAPIRIARQAPLRLVRRVVEIRDGYLTLRPYADGRAERAARRLGDAVGLTGNELDATVEAAMIAVALDYRRRGQLSAEPAPWTASPPRLQGAERGGAQHAATEVAWLTSVAIAYRRSPIIGAVLAELGRADARLKPAPPDASAGSAASAQS